MQNKCRFTMNRQTKPSDIGFNWICQWVTTVHTHHYSWLLVPELMLSLPSYGGQKATEVIYCSGCNNADSGIWSLDITYRLHVFQYVATSGSEVLLKSGSWVSVPALFLPSRFPLYLSPSFSLLYSLQLCFYFFVLSLLLLMGVWVITP